jgi:hypothetical protein
MKSTHLFLSNEQLCCSASASVVAAVSTSMPVESLPSQISFSLSSPYLMHYSGVQISYI